MAELNNAAPTGAKHPRKRLNPKVDLTAMVDLAFLLITFFMLTTSLLKTRAVLVAMPDKTDDGHIKVPASRSLTLCLGKNNQLVVYRGEVGNPIEQPQVCNYESNSLRKLLLSVKQKVSAQGNLIVLVKPSQHAVYGNLVGALDELTIAGVKNYAITDITNDDVNLLKNKGIY